MIDEEDCRLHGPTTTKWLTKARIVSSSFCLIVRLSASLIDAAFETWQAKEAVFRRTKTVFVSCLRYFSSPRLFFSHRCESTRKSPRPFSAFSRSPFSSSISKAVAQMKLDKFRFVHLIAMKRISGCRRSARHILNALFLEVSTVEESPCLPEPSVHVDVLHDPGPGHVRADVIFVHGLHGSLYNTWRQGLWEKRRNVRNLALKHGRVVKQTSDFAAASGRPSRDNAETVQNRKRTAGAAHCDSEYDHLLENISDLINDIDDAMNDSRRTAKDEEEPYSPCWPRDWLPKDCPGMRILAVNYTTDPFLWRPVWVNGRIRSTISQRSREMEDRLLELDVGRNPIIWVGHSKGGLYIKQMLIDARHAHDPQLSGFLVRAKGIMFYSVPHRGSSLANLQIPFMKQSVELMELKKDGRQVLNLHENFIKLFEENFLKAEVFSFVETIWTFMFLTHVKVVSVDSADLGLGSFRGINIDHREICKPLNRDCFLYRELVNLINRVIN